MFETFLANKWVAHATSAPQWEVPVFALEHQCPGLGIICAPAQLWRAVAELHKRKAKQPAGQGSHVRKESAVHV